MRKWKTKEELIKSKAESTAEPVLKTVVEETPRESHKNPLITLHKETIYVDTFEVDKDNIQYYSKTLTAKMGLVMNADCGITMLAQTFSDVGDGNTKMFSDTIGFDEMLEKIPDVKILKTLQKMINQELAVKKKNNLIEKE